MNNTKKPEAAEAEIRILYEDNHIIAVNKRPSEIVQGDKTGDEPMGEAIKRYIKKKYDKPGDVYLGTVHRLDRPVSGIVLFARTSKALTRLNEMFRGKEIQKTYWAVVKNKPNPSSALLTHYLRKNEVQNKSYASATETKGSLRCELEYRILSSSDHYHLLEVKPHTGRHHQIRVQLATMGSPIKGDLKYGFNRSNENASIHLHARQVDFIHPIRKEPVTIIADPPDDPLWNHFLKLLPFD
ncbi:MAG TPA: RluA family pseudouridine synthase [Bacteroidia bacterium]|jgi:23S rRNA pseudouridine1911/1915/1917 synthase|nr:RluA family pseudouridine synthase [Bacteroidia bacterium]